jgi:hypothetical protein
MGTLHPNGSILQAQDMHDYSNLAEATDGQLHASSVSKMGDLSEEGWAQYALTKNSIDEHKKAIWAEINTK